MDEKPIMFSELASLAGLPERTVRYYIQRGLVDRPGGVGRGAHYTARHLEQLLQVRRWSEAGVSLDRIAEFTEAADAIPPRSPRVGEISVRSHVRVAPGIELVIAPDEAGWSPAQVREMTRQVLALCQQIDKTTKGNEE